jgi:cob(I)alamin adenosyltransferase
MAEATPPTERPRPGSRGSVRRSLVLVYTGDGKGKTTAAMGTVLRAVARGWNVCVIQFIKSGRWRSGEEQVARRLGVEWWSIGDGFTWDSQDLGRSEDLAKSAWSSAQEKILSGRYELVILDEITYPMNWGWIPVREIERVIRGRPPHVSVLATGRDAPDVLVEVADTVTEMRKVRHAYDSGVAARRGIDF